jgi:hypothetical protein
MRRAEILVYLFLLLFTGFKARLRLAQFLEDGITVLFLRRCEKCVQPGAIRGQLLVLVDEVDRPTKLPVDLEIVFLAGNGFKEGVQRRRNLGSLVESQQVRRLDHLKSRFHAGGHFRVG